jgi:PKD repeat protein
VASLGSTFNHTYAASGTYTVTVTVTDAYGISSTYVSQVSVTVPGVVTGGGSSGGGGYYYTAPVVATSTTPTAPGTGSLGVNQGRVLGVGTTTTFIFTRTLTVGSRGDDVSALQQILKYYGFYTYPEITGYFGPITRSAVVSFQKARGLAPYPGTVGPLTRVELHRVQGVIDPSKVYPSTALIKKTTSVKSIAPVKVVETKKEKDVPSVLRTFIIKIKNIFGND